MAKNKIIIVITLFLLSALWFFFPLWKMESGNVWFAMRLALPAIILTLGGIGLLPRFMTMGFLFCVVGDVMGVIGSFEGQMGGFTFAHIYFISQFVKDIKKSTINSSSFILHLIVVILLCLFLLVIAFIKIIPAINDLPIRLGCIVYALLLCGTFGTSILRFFSCSSPLRGELERGFVVLGALLFLVSDFILSWNKFTSHIPHASLYIMITYYGALFFLFIGTLKKLKGLSPVLSLKGRGEKL
ncbi:MAG: lysoplasmalogenase [Bacteroidaceae bacterium]|nr:lysoplasmalogenase [Bacteroidaceae bacterium]